MRYTQLRAFHNVAVSGGFSRAATALNQSQPSISDQVRRLEETYDTLLFHRGTRQITLTKAGEGLLRLTSGFFEAEDAISGYLDRNRTIPSGHLRIVTDSAVHITAAIGQFRKSYPEVTVSLWSGNTQDVLARLRNYEAEIGVMGNLGTAKGFDRIELGRTPIVAVAAQDLLPDTQTAIPFFELAQWPLIFREPGSRTRAMIEAAADANNVSLTPAIQVEGREAMREIVATGAGIGFLSEAEFGHDPRLRKLALNGVDLHMTETLVNLSARRDVAVIRDFHKSIT